MNKTTLFHCHCLLNIEDCFKRAGTRRIPFLACLMLMALTTAAQVKLTHNGRFANLEIDRQPMLVLGGELSNSAATCPEDIVEVMPRMAQMGLNTVLVPAQWDLIEPVEGQYDFSLIDYTIQEARKNGLKVVFLWFGAWKNSMSCYAPLWFKTDTKRFPRSRTETGKPLEIASVFYEQVFQADQKAFSRLMEHIAATDSREHTVVMVQVENEIGMLESARDHSAEADKRFAEAVPEQLLRFLKTHKKELHPQMAARFKDGRGNWTEVFGEGLYTDEIFMAWHYACYVERLAQTARSIYDIPLFVNAAMNSRGRQPGEYPSAGPLAHLKDVWHCAAPHIDLLAPDIYDIGFKGWADQYGLADNPLFIPESRCCENSGARALYAVGAHQAVGFSAFAIDQATDTEWQPLQRSYNLLRQLQPLLYGKKRYTTWGLLLDQEGRETLINDGKVILTCRHFFTLPWDSRATDGSTWPEGGAVVMKLGELDYLIAGTGVVVVFQTDTEKEQTEVKPLGEDGFAEKGLATDSAKSKQFKGRRIGIGFVDEVSVNDDGSLRYLRRENGDQDHQGRHARISVDDFKILHVKLYEY